MGTDLNDNIGNLLTLMSPRTTFIGQEICTSLFGDCHSQSRDFVLMTSDWETRRNVKN